MSFRETKTEIRPNLTAIRSEVNGNTYFSLWATDDEMDQDEYAVVYLRNVDMHTLRDWLNEQLESSNENQS